LFTYKIFKQGRQCVAKGGCQGSIQSST
jgi:hypothetical protein